MILAANRTDARELAAYNYAEASRILDVPRSTLRAWKKGQDYYSASRGRVVFDRPIGTRLDEGLSHYDLVESFVLRSLRSGYGYPLAQIREALAIAREKYGIERLFLHSAFRHDGKDFFLDRLNDLVTLSPSHQVAIKSMLQDYLKRIDYGPDDLAVLFRPVVKDLGTAAAPLLAVNANWSFGRPIIERVGVRTSVVAMRLNAGESSRQIIADFAITRAEFDQAIRFEGA